MKDRTAKNLRKCLLYWTHLIEIQNGHRRSRWTLTLKKLAGVFVQKMLDGAKLTDQKNFLNHFVQSDRWSVETRWNRGCSTSQCALRQNDLRMTGDSSLKQPWVIAKIWKWAGSHLRLWVYSKTANRQDATRGAAHLRSTPAHLRSTPAVHRDISLFCDWWN